MEIIYFSLLFLAFLGAFYSVMKENAYLKEQNRQLLGSLYHRIGFKPEVVKERISLAAESPDRYAEGTPDVKSRMDEAVAKSEERYGGYTPTEWMKLSPETQARVLAARIPQQ